MSEILDGIGREIEKREENRARELEYEGSAAFRQAAEREEFAEVVRQHQEIADKLVEIVDTVGVRLKIAPNYDRRQHRDVYEYVTCSNPINLGRLRVADSHGRTHGFAAIEIRTKAEKQYVEQEKRRWFLPRVGQFETVDTGDITKLTVCLGAGTEDAQRLHPTREISIRGLSDKRAALEGKNDELRYHIDGTMPDDKQILGELGGVVAEIHELLPQVSVGSNN